MCNNIGIKGYQIIKVVDKQQSVEVIATPVKGRYIRKAQHLDYFRRRADLVVHVRRNQCQLCAKSYNDAIPGTRPYRRSTEPLRRKIRQDHEDGISGACLARRHQMGTPTIERIYQQETLLKARERMDWQCPRIMGIDEHTIHKGYRMATTFCNLSARKVFDIVEGRSAQDLESFLKRLKGRHRVKVICIDLSSSYRSLLQRCFPYAKIVADRFHAMRLSIHHFLCNWHSSVRSLGIVPGCAFYANMTRICPQGKALRATQSEGSKRKTMPPLYR